MSKKIVVLNGGPRSNGNTVALIREFTKGAETVGNTVSRFDLDRMTIRGCRGCLAGGRNKENPCVQKDDMQRIYPEYRDADVVVFASPMYYWGFTGQLKCVIDRLFAVAESFPDWAMPYKEAVLLMAAGEASEANYAPMSDYYNSFLKHLGWKDLGRVIAGDVLQLGDIEGKPELNEAFELGKSIR